MNNQESKYVDNSLMGFLLVDKPKGITSYDVIRKLKHVLPRGTKIGHGGTLDPLATGLLIIGIGRGATRKFQGLLHADKVYSVSAMLGVRTDTYDTDGRVIEKNDSMHVTKRDMLGVLKKFTGPLEQIPPMFSALKKGGKKLYEFAREGREVKRTPRTITIYDIELLSFTNPDFEFTAHVSGGTYIRSLVYDIGEALSVGAVITALRRVKIGHFHVQNALKINDISSSAVIKKNLLNV